MLVVKPNEIPGTHHSPWHTVHPQKKKNKKKPDALSNTVKCCLRLSEDSSLKRQYPFLGSAGATHFAPLSPFTVPD